MRFWGWLLYKYSKKSLLTSIYIDNILSNNETITIYSSNILLNNIRTLIYFIIFH